LIQILGEKGFEIQFIPVYLRFKGFKRRGQKLAKVLLDERVLDVRFLAMTV
jgi:hypothetical protein